MSSDHPTGYWPGPKIPPREKYGTKLSQNDPEFRKKAAAKRKRRRKLARQARRRRLSR